MKLIFIILAISTLPAATRTVCSSGCDATTVSALPARNCGDVVKITGIITESSPLQLGVGDCNTSPIIYESTGFSSMASGTASDGDTGLAIIQISGAINGGGLCSIRPGSNGVILRGVQCKAQSGQAPYAVMQVGYHFDAGYYLNEPADYPNNIRFYKSVFTAFVQNGTSQQGIGLLLNTRYAEVIDSEITGYAAPSGGSENQGVLMLFAIGPINFRNNRILSSQINVLTGGGGVHQLWHGQHTNVTYQHNLFERPFSWWADQGTANPSDACASDGTDGEYFRNSSTGVLFKCDGETWTSQGTAALPVPEDSLDKNRGECKNGDGQTFEGNIFRKSSQRTMLNQQGVGILINKSDDRHNHCRNILIKDNVFDRLADGLQLGSVVAEGPTHNNITVTNNLFTRLGWAPSYRNSPKTASEATSVFQFGPLDGDLRVSRVTALVEGNGSTTGGMFKVACPSCSATSGIQRTQITDSVINFGQNGALGLNTGSNIWTHGANFDFVGVTHDPASTNSSHMARIFIPNDRSKTYSGNPHPDVNLKAQYTNGVSIVFSDPMVCKTCVTVTDWAAMGFTSYSNYGASGTYSLDGASPYKGKGWFLTDPGVEYDVVTNATNGVLAGTDDGFIDFKIHYIRRLTSTTAEIRYTAFSTSACSISVDTTFNQASPVFTSAGSAGSKDRTVTLTGLTDRAAHFVVIDCGGGKVRRESFWQ